MKLKYANAIGGKMEMEDERVYSFTNENVRGYMDKLCENAKSGLIVCASGDQIINASANGVKEITGFDISPDAIRYTELKLCAIENFDRRDFMDFFTPTNEKFLNRDMFDEIKCKLKDQAQKFWESTYARDGKTQMRTHGINDASYKGLIRMNPYLDNAKTYENAQNAVKDLDLTLVQSDLVDLPMYIATNGEKHFDIGMLSNILHYTDCGGFSKFYKKHVKRILKFCDRVQANYIWSTPQYLIPEYIYESRRTVQKDGNKLSTISFPQSPYIAKEKTYDGVPHVDAIYVVEKGGLTK